MESLKELGPDYGGLLGVAYKVPAFSTKGAVFEKRHEYVYTLSKE
jgi:hypothetical protein